MNQTVLGSGNMTMTMKSLSRVRLFVTPWTTQPTRLLCRWNFLGKNTGLGCHSLLQGIFLTQRSNSGLLHCRQILYRLTHKRSLITGDWNAKAGSQEVPGVTGKFNLGVQNEEGQRLTAPTRWCDWTTCGHWCKMKLMEKKPFRKTEPHGT